MTTCIASLLGYKILIFFQEYVMSRIPPWPPFLPPQTLIYFPHLAKKILKKFDKHNRTNFCKNKTIYYF